MQTVVLFSDAHRNMEIFDYLDQVYPDYLKLCMGDCCMLEDEYIKHQRDILFVQGNSDYYMSMPLKKELKYPGAKVLYRSSKDLCPLEIIVEIEGVKLLMAHGHRIPYDVKGYLKKKKADVLLSGHTHRYKVAKDADEKVYEINPGSCNPMKVREIDDNWYRKPATICLLTLDSGRIVEIKKIELTKEASY